MMSRVTQLFSRYCQRHLTVSGPTRPLFDSTGSLFGHVDIVRLTNNRLEVHGWSLAERIVLKLGSAMSETIPNLVRADVGEALGDKSRESVGFALDVPNTDAPCVLICRRGTESYVHELQLFTWRDIRIAKFRLLPQFLLDVARAAPSIAGWLLFGNHHARTKIKRRLRLDMPSPVNGISTKLYARRRAAVRGASGTITIIIPVYNAMKLLPEALRRVEANTDVPWRLILIEDCSTDTGVRPFLRAWSESRNRRQPGQVELIENTENQGFIRSVNRGLSAALRHGDHIVLLNSDAFVPRGWASRLLYPMLSQDNVATVTPMSNDAEIMNVPAVCRRCDLKEDHADQIDAIAAKLNPNAAIAEMPTGVGFCMAMNIKYIKKIAAMDTVFGAGYGEEVDWCQKARASGGRNLGTGAVFVEHKGGSSFGNADKLRMIRANNAIISRRYPTYDREVQDFVRDDPLSAPRLALAIAWAAVQKKAPLPVFLTHSLGGGAEKYLQQRIADSISSTGAVIVLRVGGGLRWQLECHTELGVTKGATDEFRLIEQMLEPVGARRIIYSCGVGDADPISLPNYLLRLKRPNDSLEVLTHDFFILSPSYCLLDADGIYRGVPLPGREDSAHSHIRSSGHRASLAQWRRSWHNLLKSADDILVFSSDSREKLLEAYPDVAPAVRLRPHRPLHNLSPVDVPVGSNPVVGVLGNIAPQKGADVLARLSVALDRSKQAGIVLIGNIDPGFALASSTAVHGDYEIKDIPELVTRYAITRWFIPSVWPETFSYVTHEALATGLPVVCFDIGAQADAVKSSPNGRTIPYELAFLSGQDIANAILGDPK